MTWEAVSDLRRLPQCRMIVALDLSTTQTGAASPTETLTLRPPGEGGKGLPLADRGARLSHLRDQVVRWVYERRPRLVVVEAPSFGKRKGGSSTTDHFVSGFWWLVVTGLLEDGHKVAEIPPKSVKVYATGNGNADKAQVLAAMRERFPERRFRTDDEADAFALLCMAYDRLGEPLAEFPESHRRALKRVVWPV